MEALNIKEIPMTDQQKHETQSLQDELRKDPAETNSMKDI